MLDAVCFGVVLVMVVLVVFGCGDAHRGRLQNVQFTYFCGGGGGGCARLQVCEEGLRRIYRSVGWSFDLTFSRLALSLSIYLSRSLFVCLCRVYVCVCVLVVAVACLCVCSKLIGLQLKQTFLLFLFLIFTVDHPANERIAIQRYFTNLVMPYTVSVQSKFVKEI